MKEAINQQVPFAFELCLSLDWVLLLLLLVAAFVDLPGRATAGNVSLSAVLSVVELGLVAIALFAQPKHPVSGIRWTLPPLAFLCWTVLRAATSPLSAQGAQNAVIYALFCLTTILSFEITTDRPEVAAKILQYALQWVDAIAPILLLTNLVLFGVVTDDDQARWFIGPRAYALLAIWPLAWHLARRYYGARGAGARLMLWIGTLFATLSRTGSAVALMMLAGTLLLQATFRRKQLIRTVAIGVLAACTIVVLISRSESVQQRLFGGDAAIEVGGVQLNASGRLTMWAMVALSAADAPIIGHGLGSSQALLASVFDNVAHPHNDYLRIWHDLGFVGLGLLLCTFLSWWMELWRVWRRTSPEDQFRPIGPLAAMLALFGLTVCMLTDNAIVYSFVMAPTGLMIGAGLAGLSIRDLEVQEESSV